MTVSLHSRDKSLKPSSSPSYACINSAMQLRSNVQSEVPANRMNRKRNNNRSSLLSSTSLFSLSSISSTMTSSSTKFFHQIFNNNSSESAEVTLSHRLSSKRSLSMVNNCQGEQKQANQMKQPTNSTEEGNTCQEKFARSNVHKFHYNGVSTLLLLAALALICSLYITPCSSAPSPYSRLKSPREKGCYYLLKHYKNGEQIETNEPCLNCSCNNSMLMCYLRVCPYVRPLGDRCIIEKVPGECCPRIICPDVPSLSEDEEEQSALTTTTTSTTTTVAPTPEDGSGCWLDDKYYKDGAQMPNDPSKPCEVCYCIRNTSSCVMQECALAVSGCSPVYTAGSCCPTRYNCTAEAATTVPPGLRHPSAPEIGCRANGRTYVDGEAVPSRDPCEHCYCMKHEIVCAVQECQAPCEGCVPIPSDHDKCCPERYECPAPSRPVPPKNVNFGNESLLSDTTSQSSHDITGHSGIFTTTVTPGVPSEMKDIRVQEETNMAPGEREKSHSIETASQSPFSSTTHSSSSLSSEGKSEEPVVDGESSESSTLDTKESEDKNENIKQLVTPNNRPNVSSASAPLPLPAVSSSNDSSVIPMSLDENLTPSLLETGSDHHTKKDHDTNTGEQLASSSLPQGQEKPSLTTEHSAKQPVSSEPVVSTQDGVKDMEQEKPLTLSTTEASVKDPLALSTQDTSAGTDSVTDSPVVMPIPPESLKMFMTSHPASQPRRDETGDVIDAVPTSAAAAASKGQSTRRPGINRKGFPGAIPGEGICRHEGRVYQNGDEVVSSSPCVELCMCINSVVYCDETVCHPDTLKPIEGQNCTLIKSPDECCPRYECVAYTSTTASPETTTTTTASSIVAEVTTTVATGETTSQDTSSSSTVASQEDKQSTSIVDAVETSSSSSTGHSSVSSTVDTELHSTVVTVATTSSTSSSEFITTVAPEEEITTLTSTLSTLVSKVTQLFSSTTSPSIDSVKESEESLTITTTSPIASSSESSELSSSPASEMDITTITSKQSSDAADVTSDETPVHSVSSTSPATTEQDLLPGSHETSTIAITEDISTFKPSDVVSSSSPVTSTDEMVTTFAPSVVDDVTKQSSPTVAVQTDQVVMEPIETPVATSTPAPPEQDIQLQVTTQVIPGPDVASQETIVPTEKSQGQEITTQPSTDEVSLPSRPVTSPAQGSGQPATQTSTEAETSAVPTTVSPLTDAADDSEVKLPATSESPVPTAAVAFDSKEIVSEQTTVQPYELPKDDVSLGTSSSTTESPSTDAPAEAMVSSSTVGPVKEEPTTVSSALEDIVTTIQSVVQLVTGSSSPQPDEEISVVTEAPVEVEKDASTSSSSVSPVEEKIVTTTVSSAQEVEASSVSSTSKEPEEVVPQTTLAPELMIQTSTAGNIDGEAIVTSEVSAQQGEEVTTLSPAVSSSSSTPSQHISTSAPVKEDSEEVTEITTPSSAPVAPVEASSSTPIESSSAEPDLTTIAPVSHQVFKEEFEFTTESVASSKSPETSSTPVAVEEVSISVTTLPPTIEQDEAKSPAEATIAPVETSSSNESTAEEAIVTTLAPTSSDEKSPEISVPSAPKEQDEVSIVTTVLPAMVTSDSTPDQSSTAQPHSSTVSSVDVEIEKEVTTSLPTHSENDLMAEREKDVVTTPEDVEIATHSSVKQVQEITTMAPSESDSSPQSSTEVSSTSTSTQSNDIQDSVTTLSSILSSEDDLHVSSVGDVVTSTERVDTSSEKSTTTVESIDNESSSKINDAVTTVTPAREDEINEATVSPSIEQATSEKSPPTSQVEEKESVTTQVNVISSEETSPTTVSPVQVDDAKEKAVDSIELVTAAAIAPVSTESPSSSSSHSPEVAVNTESITLPAEIDQLYSTSPAVDSIEVDSTTVPSSSPIVTSSTTVESVDNKQSEVTTQVSVENVEHSSPSPATVTPASEIVDEIPREQETHLTTLAPEVDVSSSPVSSTRAPELNEQEVITTQPTPVVPVSSEDESMSTSVTTTSPNPVESEAPVRSFETSSQESPAESSSSQADDENKTTESPRDSEEIITAGSMIKLPSSTEKSLQDVTTVTPAEEKSVFEEKVVLEDVESPTTMKPIEVSSQDTLVSSSIAPEVTSQETSSTSTASSVSSEEKLTDKEITTVAPTQVELSSQEVDVAVSSVAPEITTVSSVDDKISSEKVITSSEITTVAPTFVSTDANSVNVDVTYPSSESISSSTTSSTHEEVTTTIRQVLEDAMDIKGVKEETGEVESVEDATITTTSPAPVSSTTLASLVTTMLSGIKFNGTTEFIFKEIISTTSAPATISSNTIAPEITTLLPPSTSGDSDLSINNTTRSNSDEEQSSTWSSTLSPPVSLAIDTTTQSNQLNLTSTLSTLPPSSELTTVLSTTVSLSSSSSPPSSTSPSPSTTESSEPEEEHDDTTCIFEGRSYQSAEQIQRPHPCDFCFCFRGDIICLQQTCPPPIPRCYETPIDGFCCPRYECPVQSSSSSNSTTPSTVMVRGCNVDGQFYQVGEIVRPASGPCLECKCDHSGLVQCNPQNCSPRAPLLLRMNRDFFAGGYKRR